MLKRYFYSASSVIIMLYCFLFFQIFQANSADLDKFFLVGITLLLVGAFMYVLNTGFLDLFFEGFKRLGNGVMKKPSLMEEVDYMIQADEKFIEWKMKLKTQFMIYSLGMGTGFLLVSAALSFSL
ncbi:hypothetical protein JOC86_002670 [Bacillus pakistanensis]|uniref:DUF3899 domain-containing protein n=1 Tax=Rossellomorea pakistanensis TaxID=992288 RepID=A0ABS2NE42_9BACI|nr:DUF3899 domain-containing protein [Bacillus pakistanensis]MBM7586128.1 hypothetical protein [Bacillus pakistanensis]